MAEINDWKEVPIDDWKEVPISETKEPGFLESIKALPRTALNFGTSIVSFPLMVPQWAVELQQKYSGVPYEGLLTTKLPSGETIAERLQRAGGKIQKIGEPQTEAEKRQVDLINLPFKGLAKVGEFAGGVTEAITGSPSAATLAEASVNLAPLFFGRKGGKEILEKSVDKAMGFGGPVGERMYKSALKPGVKYTPEELSAMTRMGMKEGIAVGKETGWKSLETLQEKIDMTTQRISDIVDKAEAEGKTVKTAPILTEIDKAQALYPPFLKSSELANMKEYFSQREEIPIGEARTLKQQLQRNQRNNYEKLSGLENDGEKFAAHAILDQMIKNILNYRV
jgi:hypothetical protein